MRLFVAADVSGPGNRHLGDEAIMEANLHTWTGRRYFVQFARCPHIPGGNDDGSGTRASPSSSCANQRFVKAHRNVRF